jgi:hypothetical protein
MAITLAGLGLQNVVVGRLPGVSPLLLRRLAGTTSLVLGALLGLKAFYQVSPRWCWSLWSRCYSFSPGYAWAPARPARGMPPNPQMQPMARSGQVPDNRPASGQPIIRKY